MPLYIYRIFLNLKQISWPNIVGNKDTETISASLL